MKGLSALSMLFLAFVFLFMDDFLGDYFTTLFWILVGVGIFMLLTATVEWLVKAAKGER